MPENRTEISLRWARVSDPAEFLTAGLSAEHGRGQRPSPNDRLRIRGLPMALSILAAIIFVGSAAAGDWPMWRYGPQRGAATADGLPAKLHLQWYKQFPAPQPAWPAGQDKLQFDTVYEPVVAAGRIFVPSMIHDSLTAYDTKTGQELWRFYTNGPVRFAPACHKNAVYFVSDDGYLYCVNAADGQLRWKLRGGPTDRKILGNDRLVSMWPARGAPVIDDNVVYFASGVWPFMGIFIHAVNADTGEIQWTNSGSGSNYLVQPHGSPAFAGVSPQGYLAVTNDTLIVPGGRGVPAGYDRQTGDFLFCHVGGMHKRAGGFDVITGNDWLCVSGTMCCGYEGTEFSRQNIIASSDNIMLTQGGKTIIRYAGQPERKETESVDRRGRPKQRREFKFDEVWRGSSPGNARHVMLVAGETAYASDGADRVFAVSLPNKKDGKAEIVWEGKVAGQVGNMLAADDRLFVVTREGGLFCFGEQPRDVSLPQIAPQSTSQSNEVTLVPRGARWKYLDDGSDQKAAWRAPDFDDSAWQEGPAELGYGDGDERTVISFGKKGSKKHITAYFRRAFEVDGKTKFASAAIGAKVDDGAVFYINGTEAGRLSMPDGPVAYDTFGQGASNERDYQRLALDISLLKPGRNVIAVEVHQAAPNSSDVSFDMELLAVPRIDAISDSANEDQAKPPSAAGKIVQQTGQQAGYGVVVGGDLEFVQQLAACSEFHIVVVEPEQAKVDALRRKLQEQNLLGQRVCVLPGDLSTVELPPYLCNLLICIDERLGEEIASLAGDEKKLNAFYRALRPYGGAAVLKTDDAQHQQLAEAIAQSELPSAKTNRDGGYTFVRREGPLPESAPWTHQGAGVENTMMSADQRVKAPLGLLWFGGPSHEGVLPRHGHGPTPQVVGGRLLIEGRDFLRAVDVYTGRLLWQRELPGVGMFYDNTGHHPGANAIGSNYVSVEDGVYVAFGRKCLRLDPATGKTLATFTLPAPDGKEPPYWGYIGVVGELLIAGSSPTVPWQKSHGVDVGAVESRFAEGSARLSVLDRKSGKVLWSRDAKFNFRHNAICAGGGKIYCIDRITDARLALLKRRGITPAGEPTLFALNAKTGDVAWQTSEDIFGTWLSYSAEHDILVQATARNRDRAADEPGSGLAAYRAKDGKRLWQSGAGYGGPVLVTGDRIITQGTAFELLTGEPAQRTDPLTGESSPWTFTRNYGCNTAIGCPNLLTFRSAAAGFFDLAGDGGTGNLGGFRSSCTSNLVPADGVLSAPDYTRTCTCSYQLQCSLAFVHMPEAEVWTFQPYAWNGRRVERVGINFGAPGDRRAADGTLWIDYPSVGGRSPDLPITVKSEAGESGKGEKVNYFRQHSSVLADEDLAWVATSGVKGAEKIIVKLATDDETRKYTIRLVWGTSAVTPDSSAAFDIALQGKTVASNFDLAKELTGDRTIVTQTFRDVAIAQQLLINLSTTVENGDILLCGIEIVQQ